MLKKSILPIIALISLPVVYAQNELTDVFSETIGLLFEIAGSIFTTILDALRDSPIYGKIFISAFIGIFFYSSLKEMEVFKKNAKLAGFITVLIALITAFGIPDSVTALLFSETTPFIGFVICGFILLIAQSDSNWSYAARGIAFFALMIAFAMIITIFPEWAQIIIAGLVIASLIAAIYNFTQLRTGASREKIAEIETEDIRKIVEDNPDVSDEDIAKYLSESMGEEIKPGDVKLIRRKLISKKGGEEITKKLDSKLITKKRNELEIERIIEELDREGYLADTSKYETSLTTQNVYRNCSEARKLWHELTHLPGSELEKIGNTAGEIWSKIMLNTTIFDDYIREIISLEEGITKNIKELDGGVVFTKDKKLYNLNEKIFKKYKEDILNLMDKLTKLNDFIKSLQQKILRDTNNLYKNKESEINQKYLVDKLNKILMCCEEQLRTITNKSDVYSNIINRSNAMKSGIIKIFPPISGPVKPDVSTEGFLQRFRKWLGFKGSMIKGGDEKEKSSRGEPIK